MNVETPTGVGVYFLEPEVCFMLAKQIRSAAQALQRQPDEIVPVENRLILPE